MGARERQAGALTAMFLGEHLHSLDDKGRVILPAKFREQLSSAYLTSERDGCLALRTREEFEAWAAEVKRARTSGGGAERDVARAFFAGAHEAVPDRQGRLAIPQSLREFAHLDREVAVIGAFDYVEIWDAERWKERKRSGERKLAEG